MKKIFILIIILVIIVLGFIVVGATGLLNVDKHIIARDIKDSKFISSQIDIEGGCIGKGKLCIAYFGYYKNSSIDVKVTIEEHFWPLLEEETYSYIKNGLSVEVLEKGDWDSKYFFMGQNNYKKTFLVWGSGSKIVIIESFLVGYGDYFEDFLTEYLNKYPSDLNK